MPTRKIWCQQQSAINLSSPIPNRGSCHESQGSEAQGFSPSGNMNLIPHCPLTSKAQGSEPCFPDLRTIHGPFKTFPALDFQRLSLLIFDPVLHIPCS